MDGIKSNKIPYIIIIIVGLILGNIYVIMSADWSDDLETGIEAYWNLSEGSGTIAKDFFSTHNWSVTGNNWVAGLIGSGYGPEGDENVVTTLNYDNFDTLWIGFWVKKDGDIANIFVNQFRGAWSEGTFAIMADGTTAFRFLVSDGTLYQLKPGAMPTTGWFRYDFVFNSSHANVYFNSVVNKTQALDGSVNFPNEALVFFADFSGGSLADGFDVDEINIHSRSPTLAELTQLYNLGAGITPPTPGPADTCTYSSGNWLVNCADNCTIASNVVGDASNLIIDGTGKFTMNANISGFGKYIIKGNCKIYCKTGCFVA